jgi:hypothetical protein
MFIELTDHLRCPREHAEAYLVLLPDRVEGRRVVQGILGCPVCQGEFPIDAGVVRLGDAPPAAGGPPPDAETLLAFLGLDGPGGYLLLAGTAGGAAPGLGALLPGVHLVSWNPPAGLAESDAVSLVMGAGVPVRSRSMRGAVLGEPEGRDPGLVAAAVTTVLPGLRLTGIGPAPTGPECEVLAEAGGWWVGRRR